MPDTSYYINDQSRKSLFDYITSINGKLIPDIHYDEAEFVFIESSEQFLDFIKNNTVRFFIISKDFSEQELAIKKNRFIEKPTYHIVQRVGGPYIDLALYRGFAQDSTIKYKRTDLGYYAKFSDKEDLSIEHITNNNVKIFYSKLVKFLKGRCDLKQVNGKKYYIDKEIEINQKLNTA